MWHIATQETDFTPNSLQVLPSDFIRLDYTRVAHYTHEITKKYCTCTYINFFFFFFCRFYSNSFTSHAKPKEFNHEKAPREKGGNQNKKFQSEETPTNKKLGHI